MVRSLKHKGPDELSASAHQARIFYQCRGLAWPARARGLLCPSYTFQSITVGGAVYPRPASGANFRSPLRRELSRAAPQVLEDRAAHEAGERQPLGGGGRLDPGALVRPEHDRPDA